MGKAKTHSATKKRVKLTGTGLFKRKRTGMRHNTRIKSKKAKRHLNVDSVVKACDDGNIRSAMNVGKPKNGRFTRAKQKANLRAGSPQTLPSHQADEKK